MENICDDVYETNTSKAETLPWSKSYRTTVRESLDGNIYWYNSSVCQDGFLESADVLFCDAQQLVYAPRRKIGFV